MRIISGKHKGRPLKAVPGKNTRPTTDKVKESIFQIIGPYFDGGLGLDLFAGSGGLGLEALSRGADKVIFVDQAQQAIKTIKENIQLLRLDEDTEVYRTDALRALKAIAKRNLVFDWIFLDPPYGKISLAELLQTIAKYEIVKAGSIAICEHPPEEKLPEEVGNFYCYKRQAYGKTIQVSYFRYE
jgi:16S rRNA (guanine966-N2)-methyltransferase